MHFLHKILVYIPDVIISDKKELISDIRDYAERETECFHGQVFDWRETATAGRWETIYPENVLLAADNVERFIKELKECRNIQQENTDIYFTKVTNIIGTNLRDITKKLQSDSSGMSSIAAYHLYCLSKLLYGSLLL